MEVYIVSRGELHEGSEVIEVFSKKEDAVSYALEQPTHFDGGWEYSYYNCWANGCDFVKVTSWEVK